MSTRSYIVKEYADGTKRGIYCHWDGSPESVGAKLVAHYTDQNKLEELINLGDLSSLGTEIGEKHDFDDHSAHYDWCCAYGRDRGETDTAPDKYLSSATRQEIIQVAARRNCEYIYFFDGNNQWACYNDDGDLIVLSSALLKFVYIVAYRPGDGPVAFQHLILRATDEDQAYEIGMSTLDDKIKIIAEHGVCLINNYVVNITDI